MMRLRMLLAAALAAVALVAITPSASYACSCAPTSTADSVESADAIFVGTLDEITPPPQRELMSSMDPNTFTFEVHQVLAGSVGSAVEVQSAMSGASCGWEGMEIGQEYVVFAAAGRAALQGNLCTPARGATDRLVAEVAELTGATARPLPPDLGWVVVRILILLRSFS
ncbi:hypothetical protein [Nocardioides sp. SR21]|uniref:hypothetical protein n=1 Tax=Nocardioides sp. SR21 TaxID=2919501 RepID=UPI001FAA4C1F|nr:hypothetical protein [Nocardioides sp. SR21]